MEREGECQVSVRIEVEEKETKVSLEGKREMENQVSLEGTMVSCDGEKEKAKDKDELDDDPGTLAPRLELKNICNCKIVELVFWFLRMRSSTSKSSASSSPWTSTLRNTSASSV